MSSPRILIACIGNIFLGDDAFGVEVARRLAEHDLPDEVRAIDFGIRGIDLTYALLDGYETVVLVDAAPRGGRPGTLYLIEPERNFIEPPASAGTMLEMHSLDPAKVLRLAAAMGSSVQQVLLVGCEPATTGGDDLVMEMSEPVRAAVDEAARLIESMLPRLLAGAGRPWTTAADPVRQESC
jgi:hydrogenase maturation protease